MSRRASLPGADELFRRTGTSSAKAEPAPSRQESKSTKLQVASRESPAEEEKKTPKHEEKVTFYCTAEELVDLENARLLLRREHGIAVDRGRIVREALAQVLSELERDGAEAVLVKRLAK